MSHRDSSHSFDFRSTLEPSQLAYHDEQLYQEAACEEDDKHILSIENQRDAEDSDFQQASQSTEGSYSGYSQDSYSSQSSSFSQSTEYEEDQIQEVPGRANSSAHTSLDAGEKNRKQTPLFFPDSDDEGSLHAPNGDATTPTRNTLKGWQSGDLPSSSLDNEIKQLVGKALRQRGIRSKTDRDLVIGTVAILFGKSKDNVEKMIL